MAPGRKSARRTEPDASKRPGRVAGQPIGDVTARVGRPPAAAGGTITRFLAGGLIAYGANLSLTWLLTRALGLPPVIAYGITLVTVLVLGFTLGRYWIFRARAGRLTRQGGWYLAASAAFRGLDWLAFSLAVVIASLPLPLAILAANLTVLPIKYAAFRHAVFVDPSLSVPEAGSAGGPRS